MAAVSGLGNVLDRRRQRHSLDKDPRQLEGRILELGEEGRREEGGSDMVSKPAPRVLDNGPERPAPFCLIYTE